MSNYFKANGANRPAIVLAVVVLAFAARSRGSLTTRAHAAAIFSPSALQLSHS